MFDQFFTPRGVAVIGASANPSKLGYGIARNLIISGYPGALHFVNLRGGEIFDFPVYPTINEVPDPVDLAVIIIPAEAVPGALRECGERGIKAAIVGSGGFRETGTRGEELENECLSIAEQYGMRVLGPNCIGLLDPHYPIDTSFLPLPGPIPGDIGFLSHSGAICEAVIDWARGQGFGLSRLVSLGNQMDLTEADLLPPMAEDPNTRVIALYMEGVGNGEKFLAHAKRVTRSKPILAIKVGRSERGRSAVASHTGALAGQDIAYDAAFRKAGVIRATSSESLFDWARALAWCPLPKGRKIAVLTNAGGPGAIAVDALDQQGLELSSLGERTHQALSELLPAAASLYNPVDMLAAAGPYEYSNCLKALLDDPEVDGVMVILPPPPMMTVAEVAGAMIPVIQNADKPVVIALMGEDLIIQAARLFRQAKIPDYRFPERAAEALAVLAHRAEFVSSPMQSAIPVEQGIISKAQEWLSSVKAGADGFLSPIDASQVMRELAIPVPEERRVQSSREVVKAAQSLGFPVVLKIDSPDIPHKSDSGGIALDLQDADQVRAAYSEIISKSGSSHPNAEIHGALLQSMVEVGQDVIVGVIRDEQFGPLVMFGSGGVEVEGLNDVEFALAPLRESDLDHMLHQTWAGRRLKGFRGEAPKDVDQVRKILVRLGELAEKTPFLAEIEINPLRVLPGSGGVVALDARIRLDREVSG
jgi:acetyltransferase